jgi:hypothetical protein
MSLLRSTLPYLTLLQHSKVCTLCDFGLLNTILYPFRDKFGTDGKIHQKKGGDEEEELDLPGGKILATNDVDRLLITRLQLVSRREMGI